MENPNRLIIDIFTQESLMKLKQRNSSFLQAYNDNNTIVSDTQQSFPSALQPAKQKIIIDAGHGGSDEGAKAFGLIEKNLALEIAKKTKSHLEDHGYSVFLTRNNDTEISLAERTELAQQLKANLYVAVHLNSGGKVNSPASGIETYYLNTNGLLAPSRQGGFVFINLEKDLEQTQAVDSFLESNANKSQKLAQEIQNNLLTILRGNNHPVVNRGIKPNHFRILLYNTTPTVLVEVGFMTNKTEAKLLNSGNYQELIAQGICNGISDFLSHNNLN
jgi:N-acetylmuramoyl-L-alanine amidase